VRRRGSAKVWILAWLAASGIALGGLIGIGCAIGANACPFGDEAPQAMTGEEIWLANCALCHGLDGGGSEQNPGAPSLVSGPSAGIAVAELISTIERGSVGLMPRFEGKLSDEQIRIVAEYVVELREEGS